MKKNNTVRAIFFFGISVVVLVSCGGDIPGTTTSPLTVTTANELPSITSTINPGEPTSTPAQIATATPNLTATSNSEYRTWNATAKAVEGTQKAVSQRIQDDKATKVAQFPTPCDDINSYASMVSPDGNWYAASCVTKEIKR